MSAPLPSDSAPVVVINDKQHADIAYISRAVLLLYPEKTLDWQLDHAWDIVERQCDIPYLVKGDAYGHLVDFLERKEYVLGLEYPQPTYITAQYPRLILGLS